jgi:PAS domain S-box-containing protein
VLIAEDDYLISEMVRDMLEETGYSVAGAAANGRQVVEMAQELRPDVVFMDIKMPDMDGLEATRRIQAQCPTPVVVLTAYDAPDLTQRAGEVGVGAYLTKPPNARDMDRAITIALARFEDMMALRKSREALARSRERYALAQRAAGIGSWDWDIRTGELHWSDEIEPLFGFESGQFEGTYEAFLACIHPEDRQYVIDSVYDSVQKERGYAIEHRIVWPNGSVRWVSETGDVFRDGQGNAIRMLGVVQDITERKDAEAERERLIADLDAFAHTVAHDLKSPLNGISGFAEILADELGNRLDEDDRLIIRRIIQSSNRMRSIVEELLLLASVRSLGEVTMMRLKMEPMIQRALERLDYLIERSQALITLVEPEAWPAAMGYAPWVEEVWVNYLGNAIKHGCSASEPPRIELGAEAENSVMVRFWIRDYGPGISPEDQGKLFTPFTQLGDARTEGHGLGLSIVRRIVEKLGGQVGAENAAGGGSVFSFTLPAAR